MAAAGAGKGVRRGAPPAGLRLLPLPDALLHDDGARHEEASSSTANERANIEEEDVTSCTKPPEGFTLHSGDKHELFL